MRFDTDRSLAYLVAMPTVIAVVCIASAAVGYLLFHTLAEIFSIVIAFTALIVAVTSRRFTQSAFITFLASAIGWVAIVDLVHTLAFQGMGVLPIHGANIPTQLWILARSLQALAFLSAPLLLYRRLDFWWTNGVFGLLAVAGMTAIFLGWFPDCYVDGQGLTPFKILAEYAIIGAMLAAAGLLWYRRQAFDTEELAALMLALAMGVLSELAFTQYVSVYGPANLVGHLFKIYGYWFLFYGLVEITLSQPFRGLTRALGVYEDVAEPTLIVDRKGLIVRANRAAAALVGLPAAELGGVHSHVLFHDPRMTSDQCPACRALATLAGPVTVEVPMRHQERVDEYRLVPLEGPDGAGLVAQRIRDVTELDRLRQERDELRRQLGPVGTAPRVPAGTSP